MPGPDRNATTLPRSLVAAFHKEADIQMLAREMMLLGAMLGDAEARQAISPNVFHTPLCRQMASEIIKEPRSINRKKISETLDMIGVEWNLKGRVQDAVLARQVKAANYRRALVAQRAKLEELFLVKGTEDEVIRKVVAVLSADERKRFGLEGV